MFEVLGTIVVVNVLNVLGARHRRFTSRVDLGFAMKISSHFLQKSIVSPATTSRASWFPDFHVLHRSSTPLSFPSEAPFTLLLMY